MIRAPLQDPEQGINTENERESERGRENERNEQKDKESEFMAKAIVVQRSQQKKKL